MRAVLHPAWDNRIRFSNLEYRVSNLQIGDLGGNRFDLVLHNVPVSNECQMDPDHTAIDQGMEALRRHGFLNYFGQQRFGAQKISTHEVGAALLRREWNRAVELILGDAAELLPIAA